MYFSHLKEDIRFCKHCHALSDADVCSICQTPSRSNGILCVVENIRDPHGHRRYSLFHGRYHILWGLISPIDGIGPGADLNIDSLIERIDGEGIEELIMAISPTIEGETTSFYISKTGSSGKPENYYHRERCFIWRTRNTLMNSPHTIHQRTDTL